MNNNVKTCEVCEGMGVLRCETCEGQGFTSVILNRHSRDTSPEYEDHDCFECDGIGEVYCQDCDGTGVWDE